MRKRQIVLNIYFVIVGTGLIFISFMFLYHMGSEVYYYRRYTNSMRGYFALEIVNETNKDYTIKLTDGEEGKILESSLVDAMNRLTIVSNPSENSYLLICIDTEQNKLYKEFYVASLPSHRYRIRLINGGDIKIEIIKNDKSALENYLKIIHEEY